VHPFLLSMRIVTVLRPVETRPRARPAGALGVVDVIEAGREWHFTRWIQPFFFDFPILFVFFVRLKGNHDAGHPGGRGEQHRRAL